MRQSIFIGRLEKAPELRHTHTGTPVMNLELVVLERAGESWQRHFFKITIFGQSAERVAVQAKVGSELVAFCKPEAREYLDSSGKKRKSEDHLASWIRVCMPAEEGAA